MEPETQEEKTSLVEPPFQVTTPVKNNLSSTTFLLKYSIIGLLILFLVFVVVSIVLFSNKTNPTVEEQSMITTNSIVCTEGTVKPVNKIFDSFKKPLSKEDFEIVFEIPRTGEGRGSINDVWTVNGKLAYIVTYYREVGGETTVFFDNKEYAKSKSILRLKGVTDRLAFYTGEKIVYGNKEYPGIQTGSVKVVGSVNGKLYFQRGGKLYFDGQELTQDKHIFGIKGKIAELNTTSLGVEKVRLAGQTSEVEKIKKTFTYEGTEYGTEYEGYTNETDVELCNGKPVYAVKEGVNVYYDEDYRERVIYDGEVVGKPYYKILKLDIIGNDIVFIAMNEKGDGKEMQTETVLVKNGVEISNSYDVVQDFFDHNGHLVYIGARQNVTVIEGEQIGSIQLNGTSVASSFEIVQDGQVIYKLERGEQIHVVDGKDPDIVSVGQNLAILTRSSGAPQKVIYNGQEILSEYAGSISKIFNLNGKLAAQVYFEDKNFILVERTEQENTQTSQETEKIKDGMVTHDGDTGFQQQKKFENEELGYTFLYPESWGSPTVSYELGDSILNSSSYRIVFAELTIPSEAGLNMLAGSRSLTIDPLGRGPSFGDLFAKNTDIESLCKESSNCTSFVNSKGTNIWHFTHYTYGYDESGDFYVLNPKNSFFGPVIFSSVGLKNVLEDADTKVAEIVDSISIDF